MKEQELTSTTARLKDNSFEKSVTLAIHTVTAGLFLLFSWIIFSQLSAIFFAGFIALYFAGLFGIQAIKGFIIQKRESLAIILSLLFLICLLFSSHQISNNATLLEPFIIVTMIVLTGLLMYSFLKIIKSTIKANKLRLNNNNNNNNSKNKFVFNSEFIFNFNSKYVSNVKEASIITLIYIFLIFILLTLTEFSSLIMIFIVTISIYCILFFYKK
jgi:hypothetical protein